MSEIRISTSNIFASGTQRISEAQSQLMKTQQQISANRRILTPADDPVAAARALQVTQQQAMNTTFSDNRVMARNALQEEDGALESVDNLLQSIKTQVVQAGDPALDNSQRSFIATELRANYEHLLGLVNTRDAQGRYLFSGYQVNTQPFTHDTVAGTVSYTGDQGQKMLQVGPARQLATGDAGDSIFMRVPNKVYGVAADTSNKGDVAIGGFSVTDPTQIAGHDYEVVLTGVGSAGGTQYSVYDSRTDPGHTGTPLASGAYTSGAQIAVGGVTFTLTGNNPSEGDTFSVHPNANQDIFTTLDKLITALQKPTGNSVANASLGRAVAEANSNIDSGLDSVLSARAAVGSRLNELDALDNVGQDRALQYQQELSQLQDLDYVKAMSDLTQQQFTLEAAQKSFMQTAKLSLFDLM